jgi:hypothetical protein
LTVLPGGLDGGELAGEVVPVFKRLELGFAKRVVVGDVRGAMRLGMPRSASRNATGLEVIEGPRSAWMVNCPALMCCLVAVWRIRTSASAADSRCVIIHPTAYRE